MSARSKARKRALDLLYAADARGIDPVVVLDERLRLGADPGVETSPAVAAPLNEYAQLLVRGVAAHLGRIDDVITQHAHGWTVERMPAVDRAILRIAVHELLYADDVPPAVAIDEAVQLAKTLSTDDSPRFVNGVLGQIQVIAPALRSS